METPKKRAYKKGRFTPAALAGLDVGQSFSFAKVFQPGEGAVNLNDEKSKMSRSIESRISQLKTRNQEVLGDVHFHNQSFTSILSGGDLVCGTILTCTDEPSSRARKKGPRVIKEADSTLFLKQILMMKPGESLPITQQIIISEHEVDLMQERKQLSQCINECFAVAQKEDPAMELSREPFQTTVSNGNIVLGEMIRRIK